jgi:hypothetical protein
MSVRYTTLCPNGGSNFSAHLAPISWRTAAASLTGGERERFGVAMWASYRGYELLVRTAVVYARRSPPRCEQPLPAHTDYIWSGRVVLTAPEAGRYSMSVLAVPPNRISHHPRQRTRDIPTLHSARHIDSVRGRLRAMCRVRSTPARAVHTYRSFGIDQRTQT